MRNGYAIMTRYGIPEGYYDRDGNRIPLLRWADMMNTPYRYVARTEFGPSEFVSTVWGGVPRAVLGPPPGMIFETMLFAERSKMNRQMWLYGSLDEAIAGHDEIALDLARELRYV